MRQVRRCASPTWCVEMGLISRIPDHFSQCICKYIENVWLDRRWLNVQSSMDALFAVKREELCSNWGLTPRGQMVKVNEWAENLDDRTIPSFANLSDQPVLLQGAGYESLAYDLCTRCQGLGILSGMADIWQYKSHNTCLLTKTIDVTQGSVLWLQISVSWSNLMANQFGRNSGLRNFWFI